MKHFSIEEVLGFLTDHGPVGGDQGIIVRGMRIGSASDEALSSLDD